MHSTAQKEIIAYNLIIFLIFFKYIIIIQITLLNY